MKRAFNAIMRLVSTMIGMAMAAMGGIWIVQGLGFALQNSFMANDRQWAVYGAILLLVGTAQMVWSNTRQS